MTKESKTFFAVFFIVIFFAVAHLYYDTIVLRSFTFFTSEEDIPAYSDILAELKDSVGSYVR